VGLLRRLKVAMYSILLSGPLSYLSVTIHAIPSRVPLCVVPKFVMIS